ncbi:DNA recombination protein RmuC [Desulfobulbus sp.]|uniref:DNA recombination protein RmuC n=1 Tax=Desulfobulbus sp. TaxID=895 RepID=UPI0027BA5485|nr:DNA recombination protein RmuC [Desulfobulbus sp.]
MPPLPPPFDHLELFSFLLGTATCAVFALLCLLLAHNKSQRRQLILSLRLERLQDESRAFDAELQRLRTERNQLARECREIDADNASLQTACKAMQQQVAERELLLAEARKQIEHDFQFLAGKIISEKGEQLNKQHESSLNLLLRPFHDQLLEFKQKVEEVYDRDARDRVSMIKEIEHLKQLNQQVSSDAANLTEALRGSNKIQGLWGEMVLSRLLEASGLRNGTEFAVQVACKVDGGAMYQPDVLVYLPENRTVVIDAKVSLKAFTDAHNARDGGAKQQQIKQHLDSIKKHVNLLSSKQYHQLTGSGSLDFVLLFIPIEGAFQLAVAQEPEILVAAMQKKVILASPSTLLAILRTIHHLWRLDEQNRNSLVIAKQAGSLYDKFVGFAEAFEDIGLRLDQSQQAWHTARNRLTSGQGNLIAKAEALKHLGVQSSKELPDSLKHLSSAPGETP